MNIKKIIFKYHIIPAPVFVVFVLVAVLSQVVGPCSQSEISVSKLTSKLVGIMNTECELTVVAVTEQNGQKALRSAEAALRDVEAKMSRHIELSELSKLNAAEAGEFVELSPKTLQVLRLSRKLAEQTDGAFDVTCMPIIELWKQAGLVRKMPSQDEIDQAVELTGWRHFELLDGGARKLTEGAAIDLGGIAKGYGIDAAVEAMDHRKGEIVSGLVNVGGDVRGFGERDWRVGIRNPFDASEKTLLAVLEVKDLAVCTSGNYERGFTFKGKRYSHIKDPRTGRPADMTPSVTVVAPTAAVADGWATALSVLGTDGFKLIPPDSGIEVMIVVGTPDGYEMWCTRWFEPFFAERPATIKLVTPGLTKPTSQPATMVGN